MTATFEGRHGPEAPIRERDHDRPASLDNPRSPRKHTGMPNFEKYAWLFMRFSGVVLVFLVIGGLNAFELVWLLTSQDPSAGVHTLGTFMVGTLFTEFQVGRAAAIAVLLFLMVLIASLAVLRATGRIDEAVYGASLGLPGEDIRPARDLDPDAAGPYLSTLIVAPRRGGRGSAL